MTKLEQLEADRDALLEKMISDEASVREAIRYFSLERKILQEKQKIEARAKLEIEQNLITGLCEEADALTKNLRKHF